MLLGALSVAPPVGIVLAIVLAIATRWYQFFYGTFGCSVLCVVSFFLGIEAATRGRRELRWPPEIRPRLVELGIVLGVTGRCCRCSCSSPGRPSRAPSRGGPDRSLLPGRRRRR